MGKWQYFRVNNINGSSYSPEVYALTVPKDSIKLQSIDPSSVYDSSYQGINSTFFGATEMLGIAVQNGAKVYDGPNAYDGGLKNGSQTVDRNRSTIFCTNLGAQNVGVTVYADDMASGLSNQRWSIGGLGLYLEESLTKSQYDARLADEGVSGVGGTSDRRARTMIGYNVLVPSGPVVMLVVVKDGATFFDGRTIMSNLGCTKAIHLDGGSSSSIRFTDAGTGNTIRYRASTTAAQKVMVRTTETSHTRAYTSVSGWTNL